MPERFRSDGTATRLCASVAIEHHKRQHLLIEALSHTRTPVKLRLCGISSFSEYSGELEALTKRLGLEGRVDP